MGILNCTPDSFSDGGRYVYTDSLKKRIDEIAQDETDIVDIGGESTRPGAQPVSVDEEWNRVKPAILYAKKNYPGLKLSIDTYKSEIALRAISEGADIVNDISGGVLDTNMLPALSGKGISIILMHIKGTPQTMQDSPHYLDVLSDVKEYLGKQISECNNLNVPVYAIDPGIGFGKTVQHNQLILSKLYSFTSFNLPVMIGVSRKSLFKSVLDMDVSERDTASGFLESMLIYKGASIIRTHNTSNGKNIKKLFNFLRSMDV
ncbi:MAG: dihydropteroate synthase [Ignavibacteriales bacterium]